MKTSELIGPALDWARDTRGTEMKLPEPAYTTEQMLAWGKACAAAEREACAKLVEPGKEHRRDARWGYIGGNEGVELLDKCAAAIRARGTS